VAQRRASERDNIASVTESLDLGERAAIALAETLHADLLLIDEAAGRREAHRRHIRVTGIVGVLLAAAEKGFVDVPNALERLQATSFYIDEALLEKEFARWLKK
jgi:predicted nucleic acid-binding protein